MRCSHLCTESCSVCEVPCTAGGLASEECKACAETTNCEACISCQMNASLFKVNSTDFTNGTNFTMPDCGQCIDASSECGECIRRCGSCIGNNDPFALNSDGEPCAACDACTQWIPCAVLMTQDNTNDTHWPAPCARHGLSDDFRHSKPDGLPCPEGCECCRGDGSCGECRGDYVCESRNGTGDGTTTTSG